MRAVVALAVLATVSCSVISRQKREVCDLGSERACELVRTLARQLMSQQFGMEERTRSEGDSGVKQVRVMKPGTKPYHTATHTRPGGVAAIHDHSNNVRTVGMGELIAVLNGVEFRTRHNDYKLVRPSTTSKDFHAVEDIEFPEVPQSVKDKPTVQEQSEELKEYFRAWAEQDTSIRNYKPYFKAVLSYMEGGWVKHSDDPEDLDGFQSDRHDIDAKTWKDLEDKIRFASAAGSKDSKENYAYLPQKIGGLESDTYPELCHWNYRILCHPLADDLALDRFRVVDDLATRMAHGMTYEDLVKNREARFQLNPKRNGRFVDGPYAFGLLDELMGEIPGKDNYLALLTDNAFGREVISAKDGKPLNAGFYHSQYGEKTKDASGRNLNSRGFSDANLFVALTEQDKILEHEIEQCEKSENSEDQICQSYSQKWTYAIPLEIIYMTPLTNWNPYDLQMQANDKIPVAGNRDGTFENPLNGISERLYFMTPAEFFTDESLETDDADTSGGVAYVQDQDGVPRAVMASGPRIMLQKIEGVGTEPLRLRYPILPVHNEGNSVMKQVSALIELVTHPDTYKYILREENENGNDGDEEEGEEEEEEEEGLPSQLTFETPSSYIEEGGHIHGLKLYRWQLEKLSNEGNVWVNTEEANGHSHYVKVEAVKVEGTHKYDFFIRRCDGDPMPCWDGHDGNDGLLNLIDVQ